jgi:hypothetical protein
MDTAEAVPMERVGNINVEEFIVDGLEYTRVRRYEYQDGGHIMWRGYEDGWVIVDEITAERLEATYQEDIE